MGLRKNFDTIIVINKADIEKVVDTIHQILLKRNFMIEDDEYLSCLILSEIIDDELLEENYDRVRRGLSNHESLYLLKNHKGGGALKYKETLSKQSFNVFVTFKSLNDKEIEAIIFEVAEYFNETIDFNTIINDIKNSDLEIIGITQGLRMLNDLDQETEVENILNGKINEKYKYVID